MNRFRYRFAAVLLTGLCALSLTGCGSKEGDSGDSGTKGATQGEATQNRLNDPKVSQYEKDQIKQHMGGSKSGASGSAGAGGSGGQ